jgi:hypothetical protein
MGLVAWSWSSNRSRHIHSPKACPIWLGSLVPDNSWFICFFNGYICPSLASYLVFLTQYTLVTAHNDIRILCNNMTGLFSVNLKLGSEQKKNYISDLSRSSNRTYQTFLVFVLDKPILHQLHSLCPLKLLSGCWLQRGQHIHGVLVEIIPIWLYIIHLPGFSSRVLILLYR